MVDYCSHPFHDFLEADALEVNLNSKNVCTLDSSYNFGWVEQDFGGNAAPRQAYAAGLVLIDDGDSDVRVSLNHSI